MSNKARQRPEIGIHADPGIARAGARTHLVAAEEIEVARAEAHCAGVRAFTGFGIDRPRGFAGAGEPQDHGHG
ncbi:MAG: hypothetical protein OEU09_01615 [Rhodospirillales bacterium]|nr:hypothetical protein [Rhodospirillales bacterium]MDH3909962.1 hypothetical protein [Rhodospirillales bacterium]MDH3916760.1 hypothetical protein [Rhodospirillales bacterium]MDH3969096.1 hypothetical protein [Rhodospirillales bacterium]